MASKDYYKILGVERNASEDEIKKARDTFVKRIIIGVVVFFVPAIVNVIMWIADIVWQGLDYSSCNLPL